MQNHVKFAVFTAMFAFAACGPAAAKLDGQSRANYIRGHINACLKKNKADPVGKDLLPSILKRYCECHAVYAADRVSVGDVLNYQMAKGAEKTQLDKKLERLGAGGTKACVERMSRQ